MDFSFFISREKATGCQKYSDRNYKLRVNGKPQPEICVRAELCFSSASLTAVCETLFFSILEQYKFKCLVFAGWFGRASFSSL